MTSNQNGFTLAEVLVSIFIIALLSGIMFSSYRQSARRFALQRSANKLARDIRKVEEMAMSAKEFSPASPQPQAGYGIYLNSNPGFVASYILFVDKDGDCEFDGISSGEQIENPSFEPGVEIDFLAALNPKDAVPFVLSDGKLTITLTPPDPKVTLCGYSNVSSVYVVLTISGLTKAVSINTAGLIEIDPVLPDCVCTDWDAQYTCGGGGYCNTDQWGTNRKRDCYSVRPPGCPPGAEEERVCITDTWKFGPWTYPWGSICCHWDPNPPYFGSGKLAKRVANESVYGCLSCQDIIEDPGCDYTPCTQLPGECTVECIEKWGHCPWGGPNP